jgi:hypothetical protein
MSETLWDVTFTGDRFTLHTTVTAENEEQAEANAVANMQDFYGFDLNNAGRYQVTTEGQGA